MSFLQDFLRYMGKTNSKPIKKKKKMFFRIKLKYISCYQHENFFEIKENFSNEATSLLKKLLVIDPTKRLGYGANDARDLKNHEFFKEIKWDDLSQLKSKPPFKPKVEGRLDLRHFDKEFIEENVRDVSFLDRKQIKEEDKYSRFTLKEGLLKKVF